MWLLNPKKGSQHFKKHVRGSYGSNKNMVRTMKTWAKALRTRGDLKDNNSGRTGRPRKVTDTQLKDVLLAFCKGFTVKGENGQDVWRGYTSLKDAVESGKAEVINQIIEDTGISVAQLWYRMTKYWPNIRNCRRRVDVKAALTAEVKEERRKIAAELRRWSRKKLDKVVWIDAKKLYITPGGLEVYTLDPDEVVEDPRQTQGHFHSGTQLHYYSGVNSKTGVVCFVWVTGTPGLPPGRYTTYVSAPTPLYCLQVTHSDLSHYTCTPWWHSIYPVPASHISLECHPLSYGYTPCWPVMLLV
jgi:hypothetical protein